VPGGMLMDMRFDLAMVDATGRMARYRNITM
jgi:hypothetical protein